MYVDRAYCTHCGTVAAARQVRLTSASDGDVIRDFDQVAVGVAEVERSHRPGGAGFIDRALENVDALRAHVRHRVGQWHHRDETHVRRTGNRMLRMRHEFTAGLVKIDLLRAECEGGAALPESDDGHAQDALVERATRLDAGHSQHEVVEPIDAYHAD